MPTPKLELRLLTQNNAEVLDDLNYNLELLDVLTNLVLNSVSTSTEPSNPSIGDAYWLPAGKSGPNWDSAANYSLAIFVDNFNAADSWVFINPFDGMQAYVADAGSGGAGAPLFYDSATPEWKSFGGRKVFNMIHPEVPAEDNGAYFPLMRAEADATIVYLICTNSAAAGETAYPEIVYRTNVDSGTPTVLVQANNTASGWANTPDTLITTSGAEPQTLPIAVNVPSGDWLLYRFPVGSITGTVDRVTIHGIYTAN